MARMFLGGMTGKLDYYGVPVLKAAPGRLAGHPGVLLATLLILETIWWLVFHRSYTVHVRTKGQLALKINVRLPDEVAGP
jgi:hypothetical protein